MPVLFRLHACERHSPRRCCALASSASVQSRATRFWEGTVGDRAGVRAFLGVPYAAPPIGLRRWKAPEAHEPWVGIRQADRFASRCIQSRLITTTWRSSTEDEDCLYLSIWTPAKTAGDALPVMVWIMGQHSERAVAMRRVTTGRRWRPGAWWSSASTTGSGCSGSWHTLSSPPSLRTRRPETTGSSIKLLRCSGSIRTSWLRGRPAERDHPRAMGWLVRSVC